MITDAARSRIYGPPGKVDKVTITTPWGIKVACHRLIVDVFLDACQEAHDTVTWQPRRIDSYNPRPIRGTENDDDPQWSLHAWALAFDFFATPPGIPPPGGVWTPDDAVPATFAACFTRRGFRWGATFKRRDVPHIEWPAGLPDNVTPAEDDMTPEESQKLDDIHALLTNPKDPNNPARQIGELIIDSRNKLAALVRRLAVGLGVKVRESTDLGNGV